MWRAEEEMSLHERQSEIENKGWVRKSKIPLSIENSTPISIPFETQGIQSKCLPINKT